MRITRRVVTASLLAMALSAPAFAADKPLILRLRPRAHLSLLRPYDGRLQGRGGQARLEPLESDGQVSSPKQTADIEAALAKGVKGIVLSPNESDAIAPALQEAIDAKVPVVTIDRRVPSVTGILGHVGADNVKGGEAQGNLVDKMFPNGATIINLQGQSGASPAIDRNKGLHNVLDKAEAQLQDRLGADRQLPPRQGPLGDRIPARRHGDATPSHQCRQRRHGARRDRSGQGAQPQGHRHHRLRRAARGAGQDSRRRAHRDDRAIPRQAERHRRRHHGDFLKIGRSPRSRSPC